jgi:RNA polymerase sigma-70 factor (sigma-E family)
VSGGGDHTLTGSYASAAGAAPRVANRGAREDSGRSAGASVRAASAVNSGNGAAGHSAAPARAPESGRQGDDEDPDDSKRRLHVPSARAADGAELAPRSAGIDDPEFRDYVRSRSRALLRTAYLLTGNVADAEDLVQSALAKTYLAWDRIVDRSALDGYVRRAIVNTHISWWRRRRLEEYPTDEIPDQAVIDHSVSSDLQESLRRAIDRLPQRMRTAVMLRYYDDMTEAEVAEILGVSLGTVKSTVSRAVAKLRIDVELQPD